MFCRYTKIQMNTNGNQKYGTTNNNTKEIQKIRHTNTKEIQKMVHKYKWNTETNAKQNENKCN